MNISRETSRSERKMILSSYIVLADLLTVSRLALISLLILMFLPSITVAQLDTSEESVTKDFQKLIHRSQTIIDAKVLSKESFYLDSTDVRNNKFFKKRGIKTIYTNIKFQVFQTIKGTIENNEFSIVQKGGKIGKESYTVVGQTDYILNERAVYCFGEKDSYGQGADMGRFLVFVGKNNIGTLQLACYNVGLDGFINALKQTLTDTSAFRKYYRNAKGEEIKLKKLIYRNIIEEQNKIKQRQSIQKKDTSNSGGAK